jgi:uroporphyrinogen-III synthase
LADALRALDLEPVLIPTIELAPPTSFAPIDEAVATLDTFHWLIFTSANAVEAFASRSRAGAQSENPENGPHGERKGSPLPTNLRVAAIGPSTARAVELLGTKADLVPPQAVAESLASALLPHAVQPDGTPTRFLLIRAETARDHLPNTLREAGADVTIAPAYRTTIPESSSEELRHVFSTYDSAPQAITFTSSSSVQNLLALLEVSKLVLPPDILRISIGPITSETMSSLGIPAHAEAEEATVSALALAVSHALHLKSLA